MTEEKEPQQDEVEQKEPGQPKAEEKKPAAKRSLLGPGQIIGLLMITVAAVWHFGTKIDGVDLLIKPREIRCTFLDENDTRVPGIIVERSVAETLEGIGVSWEKWGGPSDMAGNIKFVIGGHVVSVRTKKYVWGLHKKSWREGEVVAYRFVKDGATMPPLLEEQFMAMGEVGRVDPNDTDFAGKLDAEMLDDDGMISYSVVTMGMIKGSIDPNALPPVDANSVKP